MHVRMSSTSALPLLVKTTAHADVLSWADAHLPSILLLPQAAAGAVCCLRSSFACVREPLPPGTAQRRYSPERAWRADERHCTWPAGRGLGPRPAFTTWPAAGQGSIRGMWIIHRCAALHAADQYGVWFAVAVLITSACRLPLGAAGQKSLASLALRAGQRGARPLPGGAPCVPRLPRPVFAHVWAGRGAAAVWELGGVYVHVCAFVNVKWTMLSRTARRDCATST